MLEPNGVHKGHVIQQSGTAAIFSAAINEEMGDLMTNINVIGCDGTNTNVGRKTGVIVRLETMTNRPLQWNICLLHMNELPLRHLVKKMDGETSGPKSFTGPLGKMLLKADSMPVVQFEAVSCEDLCVTTEDISTDKRYLLRIFNAVKSGFKDESLDMTEAGNISHARWITSANRLLRLHVASEDPSDNLIRIVYYIMRCYIPTWFSIKCEESIFKGSKDLFGLIQRCQTVDNETKEIFLPVIQNNSYFILNKVATKLAKTSMFAHPKSQRK